MENTTITISTTEYHSLVESSIRLALITEAVKSDQYITREELCRYLGIRESEEM